MFNTALSTSLWMGDLGDLDEHSIISAFAQWGEVVMNIKMMRDAKHTGSLKPGDFCFVEFPDVDSAQRVLHRLNGKYIPGKPGRRFKLNPASYGKEHELLPEFSLYVGELSWNVDDYQLYQFFQKRYKSVRGAKVVMDQNMKSKGFGFVRFSDEHEQQRALIEMQHMTGLGRRPIKVSLASIKKPNEASPVGGPAPHGSYYAGHYSWGGYHYHFNQTYPTAESSDYGDMQSYYGESNQPVNPQEEDDSEFLEDPGLEINVGKENREYIDSSESFFSALEQSRWQPLDNIMSEIPD